MKKEYEQPEFEVIRFTSGSIMEGSSDVPANPDPDPDETPVLSNGIKQLL